MVLTSTIFFCRSKRGLSKSKVTGFGFSFKGLKGERWLRTPPFTFRSGSSGHGYSCLFTFLTFAEIVKSLRFTPSWVLPSAFRGTPQTELLELLKRSEAEGLEAKFPVNDTGDWVIEPIFHFCKQITQRESFLRQQ